MFILSNSKRLKTSDIIFIFIELSLGSLAAFFETIGISSIPLIVSMIAIAIHFSWNSTHNSEITTKLDDLDKHLKKLDDLDKHLKKLDDLDKHLKKLDDLDKHLKKHYGEVFDEVQMLDYYKELKKDAVECSVVWCLKFSDDVFKVEQYLNEEKELLNQNTRLEIRRIINDKLVVPESLNKYRDFVTTQKLSRYEDKFCDNLSDFEIGYSKIILGGKTTHRALIILADIDKIPKIGFFFDENKNPNHIGIIMAIKKMFDKEWERADEESVKL